MADKATKYPECEKLKRFNENERGVIVRFLEYLGTTEGRILRFVRREEDDPVPSQYVHFPVTESMLMDFAGVDVAKLEEERQEILEECRQQQLIRTGEVS